MPTKSKSKILIVDDEPLNVILLTGILKGLGEVISATNGEDALAMIRAEAPDLIVLDVVMPGIDGHEVCRRLKADEATQAIPVIFATGNDKQEDEAFGLELGAVDFIKKPIHPRITLTRVRNHLESKRHRDLLEELAFIDGLTGIANRRRFDEMLADEWRRCSRSGKPISLILMDIDHFKAYNDNYGHGGGDECLRRVALALENAVQRPGDTVARYGGEEFAYILPETDSAGAEAVAGVLLDAVRQLNEKHEFSSAAPMVTISAGVATVVPTAQQVPQTLIEAADVFLYQAKEAGRNRGVSGKI